MSETRELQKLIRDTLLADPEVATIVGRNVFDNVPSDDPYPRIVIGESDALPDDADCIAGDEITFTLHCWMREKSKLNTCRNLVDLVKAALHEQPLEMPDPFALSEIRVTYRRVFPDPDGKTAHGVLIVTSQVET